MIPEMMGFLNLSWVDFLDVAAVSVVIYAAFKWIKGSSAMNIFIAIIILVIARVAAAAVGMKMISSLLGTVLDVGAVALIVIFQPEIRRFLNNLGRSAGNTIEHRSFLQRLWPTQTASGLSGESASQIAQACFEMSGQKTGALIIIRRGDTMEDIISTGDRIDARISSRLIMNIFFKNSPLHDGAMIIGDDRIVAARCTLPISDRQDLPARFGMRHKAAVGISERTDADVIVVSEQTGGISFVHENKVTPVSSINELKLKIRGSAENTDGRD